MKPLELTLSAFGNYADKTVIDFTKLNGRNLFLITGNTGAGKTTIFDAISYALYGAPSGDFRDTSTLRSHYVDGDVETFVDLEFQLRNKRYRIRRSPEQLLNKKRGEGYKKEAAKVELCFLDSDEKPITKVKEVEERINELLGVDKEQFRQIVMLPQGEFIKLLKANSKEREEIFRKIFGTEGFKRVQDKLRDKVKDIYVNLKDEKNERDIYAKQIKAEEHSEIWNLINNEDLAIDKIVELTVDLIKKDIELKQIKEDERNQLRKEIKKSEDLIRKIELSKKIIEENNYNLKNLEEHKTKLEVVKEYEERLNKGKKAEKVNVFEKKYKEHKEIKIFREESFNKTKVEKAAIELKLKASEENLLKAKGKNDEREKLIVRVEDLKKKQEMLLTYDSKKSKVNKLNLYVKSEEEELKLLKDKIIKEEEVLKECDKKIKLAIEAKGEADLIQARGKSYGKEIERLKKLKDSYENVRYQKIDYDEKKDSFNKVDKEFKEAKSLFENKEDAFKKGQAGLLAESLENGVMCPVCGSLEHPNKAVKLIDVPREDELKILRNNFDKRNSERETLLRDLSILNEKIKEYYKNVIEDSAKELITILGENFISLAESEQRERVSSEGIKLNTLIEEERNRWKSLSKVFSEKENLEKRKVDITDNIEKEKEAIENLSKEIKKNSEILAAEIEGLSIIEKDISEEFRNIDFIEREISKLVAIANGIKRDIDIAEKTYKALNEEYVALNKSEKIYGHELEKDKKNLEESLKAYEKSLDEQGFKGEEDYKVALGIRDLDLIDRKIKSYYENLRALEALVKESNKKFNELENKDRESLEENLEKLNSMLNNLNEEEYLKNKECNIFGNRSEHNKEMIDNIAKVRKKIGAKEKVYENLSHLSNIANGDRGNLKKITFESYVLTSYFDEIIRCANRRLDTMTNGRFLLKRKEDLAKGNKKQGLELEVYDNNTGRERGVNSLSGGESFKAALCLALGLADVIQSYAGGISIDTMFVDEGFGTLDPQSLDNAIECLVNIQEGGRLVGIISHVDELKERIDAKLMVKSKENKGSTAEFAIR